MNELYRMLLEAVARGQKITRKTDTATGDEALFIDGSLAWGDDIKEGLEENLVAEPVLVLFGAGHVSKALYDIASLHSMRTIILDIIPCHLEVEFYFRYLTWAECHERGITWAYIHQKEHTWFSFQIDV